MNKLIEVKNIFDDPVFCESQCQQCRFRDKWGQKYTCILHEISLDILDGLAVKCDQCKIQNETNIRQK